MVVGLESRFFIATVMASLDGLLAVVLGTVAVGAKSLSNSSFRPMLAVNKLHWNAGTWKYIWENL